MTPAEKRYYKTHYGSAQNKLTELFNFVNKLDKYDENVIRNYFKGDKLSKNLKVYKNLLFDLLMKALISYQSAKDPKAEVLTGLQEFQILMDKKLFVQAERKLRRLRAICKDNQLRPQEFLLKVEEMELRQKLATVWQGDPDSAYQNSLEFLDEMFEQVELLKSFVTLHKLSRQVSHLSQLPDSTSKHNELYSILDHELLSQERMHDVNFHYVSALKSMAYTSLGNLEKAYSANLELIRYYDRLEINKKFLERDAYNFISCINNFLYVCVQLKRYSEVDYWVERAKLLLQYKGSLGNILAYIYSQEISSFRARRMFDIIAGMEQTVSNFVRKQKMSDVLIGQILQLEFCINKLTIGQVEEASAHLQSLGATFLERQYPGLVSLLRAMCWYELGEYKQIKSLLNSRRKSSLVIEENTEFGIVAEGLKQVIAREYTNDPQIWRTCLSKLSGISQEIRYGNFRVDAWLLSRINNTTMAKQLKQLHRKRNSFSEQDYSQ